MKRLVTENPEDNEYLRRQREIAAFERSKRELADHYSKPQRPNLDHRDWHIGPPSNPRNGKLTSSEYELVEMACTMSGRLAISNIETRCSGVPPWTETGQLPVLPIVPVVEEWQRRIAAPADDHTEDDPRVEVAIMLSLLIVIVIVAGLMGRQ